MKQLRAFIILALFTAILFCQIASQANATFPTDSPANTTKMKFLHTEGDRIINESNETVHLRGVNIGSWLLLEPWILGDNWGPFITETGLWNNVSPDNEGKPNVTLIHTFRNNWFNESDVQKIHDAGLNCIRLPIWWRATNDSIYGGGYDYINKTIEWCKKYNVYIILDLHGAPGGQNKDNKALGEISSPNDDLWNSPRQQVQFREWWNITSRIYRNESTIAGYDLLNEASPSKFSDMIELYNSVYNVIRKNNSDNHIIILEASMYSENLTYMPLPKEKGWENVVYSFHYYPLGNTSDKTGSEKEAAEALESIKALNKTFPELKRNATEFGVPILVGEFNVINKSRGGADRLAEYIKCFDSYGWSWTLWTYKKIEVDSTNGTDPNYLWGLYGYVNEPIAPDFRNSTQVEEAFRNMSTNNTTKLTNDNLNNNLSRVPAHNLSEETNHLHREFELNPCNIDKQNSGSIETQYWLSIPNLGKWTSGESVNWSNIKLDEHGNYTIRVEYATPHDDNTLSIRIDNRNITNVVFNRTGNCDWKKCDESQWNSWECKRCWENYTTKQINNVDISELNLRKDEHNISVSWNISDSEIKDTYNHTDVGNLRRVLFLSGGSRQE